MAASAAGASRTLFVSHASELGGAELALLEQLRGYRSRCAVAVFADGAFRRRVEASGVPTIMVPAAPGFLSTGRDQRRIPIVTMIGSAITAFRLARVARQFDVVVANSQKALVACALSRVVHRKRVVWILHDLLTRDHFSRSMIRGVVALANRFADSVLAVSSAVRDAAVTAGLDGNKIHVVIQGVDSAPFDRADPEVVARCRGLVGDATIPLVGAFSRLAPWKGQHLLLDAVARLPDVHLLLAGGPLFGETAYEAALHERVAALDLGHRVHFVGHRDDVASLMQAVDIVVHVPTAPEPFGRTVVEAMFAGKPVITVDDGGIHEIIDAGTTALVVADRSPVAIAAAIETLLADADRRDSMGRAGCARARAHFTSAAATVRFERQVLGEVAA